MTYNYFNEIRDIAQSMNVLAVPCRVGMEECSLEFFFNLGETICFSSRGREWGFSQQVKLDFLKIK